MSPSNLTSAPTQSASPRANVWRRWTGTALRLAVVLLIYAIIFRAISFSKLAGLMTPKVGFALLAATALIFVQVAFCAWRWTYLARTRTKDLPAYRTTFWIYVESLFVNQFLPSTVGGDVYRVLRWRKEGVASVPAAASVFLDRLSGLVGAALVAAISVPLLYDLGANALALTAAGLSAAVCGGTVCGFLVARWPKIADPLRRFDRVWTIVENLRKDLKADKAFIVSAAVSVIGHALSGLAAYSIALSLGVDIGADKMIILTSLIVLISVIPITVSGWGLRELSYISFLAPFGVDKDRAFAIGLLLGLSFVLTALPGGVSTLFRWGSSEKLNDMTLEGDAEPNLAVSA